jgi:hypothetical protein
MIPTLLLFFGLGVAGVSMSQTIASAPEARLLGIVDFGSEKTKDVVAVPEAVRVNEDFRVTISTFGGGCERTPVWSSRPPEHRSWSMILLKLRILVSSVSL